ncbi:poly-beta-1,6-N-acetyl-D-glucosamine N-deacetylase PgaB [Hahella sp. CCB-MM4]|uniref:poly-beta-1,6-N-acetyl-D-glucosamine N-deacetylase PgaB n=1 Tax=Hahella sp. (strain CCB-MM4) TaxID=1926491 RepID=UPI000B9BD2BA|nr:poly-beta-1,6-N-acetyl-D-glucosamine N-deacetylase PgaB [Hahella sp. CCB-MM4]OZG73020.1 poly-beta-1,6-N-acetyl-D-glucosamine N-deacetylase PgaB [Hahella sp. CCB-MM4]
MKTVICLAILIQILFSSAALARPENSYVVLAYHDLYDVKLQPTKRIFANTVSRDRFIEHLNWIKQNNYHPVSFQQILEAKAGKSTLPQNAVLLTFDDGYESFYTTAFPLLKLYGYPAVIGLVGKWLESEPGQEVQYGKTNLDRKHFLNWAQIREMEASGLIEFASHTFNLHYGIFANPFGNEQPAAVSPQFDKSSGQYETPVQYEQRLRNDFQTTRQQMKSEGIREPRILIWPYGAYSEQSINFAREEGYPFTFSLDEGYNLASDTGDHVYRYLMDQEIGLEHFDRILQGEPKTPVAKRILHVDLDYVYDSDPKAMQKNIDLLIERVSRFRVNTVYLQAFADPDGNGVADKLYFPNRHLPVRADIFNRVAWQLRSRAGVRIYAWMPVLAFDLGKDYQYVTDVRTGKPAPEHYLRLSPFSEKNLQAIDDIYEDLGFYGKFHGILFHDDAFLGDFEDASPEAQQQYSAWGLDASVKNIRDDIAQFKRWSKLKTDYLIKITHRFAQRSNRYFASDGQRLQLARNMYAQPVLNPNSETWYAQNLEAFAEAYDDVAVMAMPFMEQQKHPEKWLRRISRVALDRIGPDKLVFELQALDWRNNTPVPDAVLKRQMQIITEEGLKSFGYYPDDFISGVPDLNTVRPDLSLNSTLGSGK